MMTVSKSKRVLFIKEVGIALSLLSLLLISSCGNGDSPDDPDPDPVIDEVTFSVETGNSEIPYIIITTSEEIQNEPKVPATMQIFVNKEQVASSNIGIEFRGSTSFRISDKKSFGIETWDAQGNDTDASFFGFPEEEDWILMGHVVNETDQFIFDRTLMYHYLGYNWYRDMGRYASRTQFVELQIDDEYLGVYVFMEKLKRDNERIDISRLTSADVSGEDITGGYILKIDKTTGGDLNLEGQPLEYFLNNWDDDARYLPRHSFRSNYSIFGEELTFEPYNAPYHSQMFLETYFIYEYPKPDDITEEQKSYIRNYINDFETALLDDDFSTDERTYTDYIDLESFVDFFILNELVRNVDGYRLSTYLQKDRNGKLAMGPVWDLNIGYDTGDRVPLDDWVINYNNFVISDPWMMPFWWPRLIADPVFIDALKSRWNSLRGSTLSTSSLINLIDESASYLQTNGAVERNYSKWSANAVDYEASIQSLKDYIETRANWMDSEIAGL